MDLLTFISKIFEVSVSSLAKIASAAAWPVAVVLLALKFRTSVGALLSRLTEATLPGGISTKFSPDLDRAEAAALTLPAAPNLPIQGEEEVRDIVDQTSVEPAVIAANPTGVIMEMWLKVVGAATDLLMLRPLTQISSSIRKGRGSEERTVFNELMAKQLITPEEFSLVSDLRTIRNRAAHSQSDRPSANDADRFRALAEKLILTWAVRELEMKFGESQEDA
ncbi:hypothetical protein [Burkholderia cepacia]|uniref:hypothetical protein n=1 Tax=Burkholderia cepacia TaxID=292 RepID=UPI0012D9D6A2|nr:hypothetical protein [Burkholderia cepacia]